MPDHVMVTVADDRLAGIDALADRLRAAGVRVEQVLPTIGVITGSVTAEERAMLGRVPGVVGIEEQATYQLPPPVRRSSSPPCSTGSATPQTPAHGPGGEGARACGHGKIGSGVEVMVAEERWIARLTPLGHGSVEDVLALSLGLDVWERQGDSLVVAATENQLSEVERRRLAAVVRISRQSEYVERARRRAAGTDEGDNREGGSR